MDLKLAGINLSRRRVIATGALGLTGLAAAALVGCGGDDEEPEAAATGESTESASLPDSAYPGGKGELIQNPDLPYPYNYPEPAIAAKSGGIMRAAQTWDISTMDPTKSAAGGTMAVPNMVYSRLLYLVRGPRANPFKPAIEGELAQSWERTPDGLTFTFSIRPGIKWQNAAPLNGRAFIAEDGAYALNRYAVEGVHQAYYTNVESIQAVNDLTLKISMKRATADFINPLGSDKQTIFPRELVEDGSIERKLIGTGPMIIKEAIPSDKATFDTNPDYWRRKVLVDGFEFRIMPDHSARLAAFRTGQVDWAGQLVSSLGDVEALKRTNPDIQVNMPPLTYVTHTLAMSPTLPKYQDERVRRAISLAIDRQQHIDIIFERLGRSLNVIPWPYLFDEEPTVDSGDLGNWMRYDPTEAKALLDAAGMTDLVLNNQYYAYASSNERQAELLVPQFREVGITLDGGKTDYTQFNSQWVGGKLADVTTTGWQPQGFDPDNWFHGEVHSQSPGNRWRINDREMDGWAEEQQVELDPEARQEIWRKIWDKDLDMVYRIPLPAGFGFDVLQPWLRGIRWAQTLPGDSGSYYNWGSQVEHGWLNK